MSRIERQVRTILSSVVLASLFGLAVFAEPAEDLTNRELKIWVESQNREMRAWIGEQNKGMREWMEVKFGGIEARLGRLEATIYGNPHGGMRHDLIALRTKVDTVIWLGGALVGLPFLVVVLVLFRTAAFIRFAKFVIGEF